MSTRIKTTARYTKAVVLSATSEQMLLQIPSWSKRLALIIRRDGDPWPTSGASTGASAGSGTGSSQPAVGVEYRIEIDTSDDISRVLGYQDASARGGPLAAPCGLPGPPDLLPIGHDDALTRLMEKSLSPLSPKQKAAIRYLVRRAHGQGFMQGINQK